ncbi:hypothetical protein [Psychrobacter aquimaris]|nr:hypothetical protein [Psychrobacter aquimaris]
MQDGALIPSSAGVNPYVFITGFSVIWRLL